MYAISVEEPQAAAILTGAGPLEYPFWGTEHRGLLLIHAKRGKTPKGLSGATRAIACNALVGVVELVDCIASGRGGDPDEVEYHWVLANPRVFARPLPYAGRLGLFLVSDGVVAVALTQAGVPGEGEA